MNTAERERLMKYKYRNYSVLGPKALLEAKTVLFKKLEDSAGFTIEVLEDIVSDLMNNNNWTMAEAMAYFECLSIEERQ